MKEDYIDCNLEDLKNILENNIKLVIENTIKDFPYQGGKYYNCIDLLDPVISRIDIKDILLKVALEV